MKEVSLCVAGHARMKGLKMGWKGTGAMRIAFEFEKRMHRSAGKRLKDLWFCAEDERVIWKYLLGVRADAVVVYSRNLKKSSSSSSAAISHLRHLLDLGPTVRSSTMLEIGAVRQS